MSIWNRIYADYLAPPRFEEYRRLIEMSLEMGYNHYTIKDLHARLVQGHKKDLKKVFVHRHDIDTDPKTARLFFEIERKLSINATYYARLETLDIPLMRDIHASGGEIGYHYEELATVAKRMGLKNKKSVFENIDLIREEFKRNFCQLEDKLGFKIITVASHGDFANRKLGIANTLILEDKTLREKLSIQCETYDDIMMAFFDMYISDAPPKQYYKRGNPFEAIKSGKNICLLSHPRQWRTNFRINTKFNIMRMIDELKWRTIQ